MVRPLVIVDLSAIFQAYSLVAGDDDSLVDVLGATAAREVVDRTCETLEDRAHSLGTGKTLHEFVGDVAHFKTREHEHIRLSGNGAARSLAETHRWHNSGISLKLAVDSKSGIGLACKLSGFHHLRNHLV